MKGQARSLLDQQIPPPRSSYGRYFPPTKHTTFCEPRQVELTRLWAQDTTRAKQQQEKRFLRCEIPLFQTNRCSGRSCRGAMGLSGSRMLRMEVRGIYYRSRIF